MSDYSTFALFDVLLNEFAKQSTLIKINEDCRENEWISILKTFSKTCKTGRAIFDRETRDKYDYSAFGQFKHGPHEVSTVTTDDSTCFKTEYYNFGVKRMDATYEMCRVSDSENVNLYLTINFGCDEWSFASYDGEPVEFFEFVDTVGSIDWYECSSYGPARYFNGKEHRIRRGDEYFETEETDDGHDICLGIEPGSYEAIQFDNDSDHILGMLYRCDY